MDQSNDAKPIISQQQSPQGIPFAQNTQIQSPDKPFWQIDAFVVLLLVLCYPLGLLWMWIYASWRKRVKVLVTFLFFLPFILIFAIFATIIGIFAHQQAKVVSYGPPPSAYALTATPEQTKVYYFEDLHNGFTKVTSPKYTFSFEYPSNLKTYPPFQTSGISGMVESIGFQSQKRFENDPSGEFVITVAPANIGNPCESYKRLPNWTTTTVNGFAGVKSGSPDNQELILCKGTKNYSFSYTGKYIQKTVQLTPQDKQAEKEAYNQIINTFTITP